VVADPSGSMTSIPKEFAPYYSLRARFATKLALQITMECEYLFLLVRNARWQTTKCTNDFFQRRAFLKPIITCPDGFAAGIAQGQGEVLALAHASNKVHAPERVELNLVLPKLFR
jgi:hypothetical protein